MATVMPCPTCNRPVEWSEKSPWRPFCTERCKLIDLGAWAAEKRGIAADEDVGGDPEDILPDQRS